MRTKSLAARRSADGTSDFRGLGHLDSHEDILTVTFKLTREVIDKDSRVPLLPPSTSNHKSRRSSKPKHRATKTVEDTLEVEIAQDKTALRSRKGDTGSVLWHASVDFAQVILRQLYNKVSRSFFDHDALSKAHVLELGAGTGLLGIVFSPYVRHYTSTDIADLVPLISKNIARNLPFTPSSPPKKKGTSQTTAANVTAIALDWLELLAASVSIRPKLIPADPVDLLLVVDCIYHPSLLPALLATMDYLTVPGRTVVVVVVELRAEDVVREFLKGWLDMAEVKRWEIWSVAGLVDGPYAVWVGWKGVT